MDSGAVNETPHYTTQGVQFPDHVPFPDPADTWIAAHLADLIQIQGEQSGVHPHPGGDIRSLNARVPTPYHHQMLHAAILSPELNRLPLAVLQADPSSWEDGFMRVRLSPEERRERRRKAVQRSKFALPSIITLFSVACGFSSVVMSINAAGENPSLYFVYAAALLVLAGVFDGLDGRVARATNTTTEFGVQLDSLADVVSFGMAPAILAYRYGFFQIGMADHLVRNVGWAACFFFVACGALRLARFNIQVGVVDSRYFVGMPIPAGAACVASVILCWPEPPARLLHAYLLATMLFLVALLMVSTVRFPSFKKKPKSPKGSLWSAIGLVALLSLLIIFRERFFLGFFGLFIVMALALNLAWKLGWRGILPPDQHPQADVEAEPS
jgi:CDP-diacylglycerol--serine O-phosphatidyltransferase